jgi:hypothetical protein
VGTIPNCLLLNHHKIRFIAPSPASSIFDQAICSVTPEELDGCVFPDKDGTPKFKVAERGVFIDSPVYDLTEIGKKGAIILALQRSIMFYPENMNYLSPMMDQNWKQGSENAR